MKKIPCSPLRRRLAFALLVLIALAFRGVGLYRGLEQGDSFHPDTNKQVQATRNYLAGHYLWYTGSLAYDGYPFGLNRVDDALIRLGGPLFRGVWESLHPGQRLPVVPDRVQLFYILRTLRVAYSLLAFLLLAWALRRSGIPERERFYWLLLAATAPLATTVTHDASGDVGTDLFAMLALALLAGCRQAVPGPLPFLGAGLAVGMGFACKYHGALVGLSPGLFLLLAPMAWRRRFQLGIPLALGALAGFALLTPALFIRFGKTLKNIRLNFTYIRRYGVDADFWEQPKSQQVLASLQDNLPTTAWALGGGLLLLGLLGLALAARAYRRQRGPAPAWSLAVLAMPLAVILLATTGKPQLQPFHFSFLPLPLIFGAALAWQNRSARLRPVFIGLLAFALATQGMRQRDEWMLWSREDTRQVAFRLSEELLLPASESRKRQNLATFVVEGPNLAVFRNGPQRLRLADARDWQAAPKEDLPSLPWSGGEDWIFLDLPLFARETRLLELRPGEPVERLLIGDGDGSFYSFHVRAGSRSARARIRINGRIEILDLTPGEFRELSWKGEGGEAFTRSGHTRRRHRLRAETAGGPVLLSLVGLIPVRDDDPERLARKMDRSRFLEGQAALGRDSDGLLGAWALPRAPLALSVDAPASSGPWTLWMSDAQVLSEIPLPLAWSEGSWKVAWSPPTDWTFSRLRLEGADHKVPWRIRPIPTDAPTPADGRLPVAPGLSKVELATGGLRIGDFGFPERLAAGGELRVHPRVQADEAWREKLPDYVAFLHLFDAAGKQVWAADIPLARLPDAAAAWTLPQVLGRVDLPPGPYEIRAGVYHPRTGAKLRPRTLGSQKPRDGRIILGTLILETP